MVNKKNIHTSLKITFHIFGLLLIPFASFSQNNEDTKNKIIEQRIEYLSDATETSDVDYTSVFEQLNYFFEHPINLNRASASELRELSLFTDIQINNLIAHIEKNGKLMSLEELQSVDGFDIETIRLILPFVKVTTDLNNAQLSWKELIKNGENQVFVKWERVLEEKKGFSPTTDSALLASPNSRYLGSGDRIYTRYKYNYGNHMSFGFTAEKDAGEQFFTGSQQQGFDFYSAHFFMRNQGKIKQLALGDFQAQFGQGLTFWTGTAFGKSVDIMSVKRSAVGLKPYTSVDENLFLRGGGITLGFNDIEVTSFYSRNRIDANINIVADSILLEDNIVSITSFQQTGFHRTAGELADKDAIVSQTMGGHVAYKSRKLNVGFTGVYNEIDINFNPTFYPYSQFRNNQSQQTNLGLDYNWIFRNFNFFGEFTKSAGAGTGLVTGALVNLDNNLSLSVLYRDYARDFHSISSVGIGENSTNENERGLFLGIVATPIKYVTLSAYFDQFTFPWLKYQVNAPSYGYQYTTQLMYKPTKKIEMYVRVREGDKLENTDILLPDGIDYITSRRQTNYRYNVSYSISPSVKLKNRIELINVSHEGAPFETGYMIYQDIDYQALSSPFSFTFRYGIFETDSYNSRIYAYENDVLNSYTIPAYYNRGTRTYLTIRYKIRRGIDVWLRYGLTYYDNLDVISSGLEEILGNAKSDVKFQVRFKF